MIYTKSQNTYFATPQENPKDLIAIEVGDSKQPDFYPQLKVMRWDNEVNFSARLVNEETAPKVSKLGEKVKWEGEKVSADIYALEEGHEFEVILKEKPKTNVVSFTIQDKGVEYFYQPELTEKEIEEGANRPENIIGSYAVYAKTQKTNYVGGKEYKCGKVGHIYRPKIIDSAGTEVWGYLHIENGILSVTIPQDFLDKAVYPVRHAAGLTFGYTSAGATYIDNYNFLIGGKYTLSADGSVTSMTAFYQTVSSGKKAKCAIYTSSGASFTRLGVTEEITNPAVDGVGQTFNFGTPVALTAADYLLASWADGATVNLRADSSGGNIEYTNNYVYSSGYPNPFAHEFSASYKVSIYATYTAGGGGGTNMKVNIGDVWKDVSSAKINIGDTWKDVIHAKISIGDVWKDIF